MFATAEKFPSDTLTQSWTEMKHSCQKTGGGHQIRSKSFLPTQCTAPSAPSMKPQQLIGQRWTHWPQKMCFKIWNQYSTAFKKPWVKAEYQGFKFSPLLLWLKLFFCFCNVCKGGERRLWTCELEGSITGTLQFLFHPGLQSVSKHLLCEYISSLWKLQLCRELHWSGASQGIAVSQNTKSCSPGRAASGTDWICKGLKSFTAVLSNTNICMFFVWNKHGSGEMFHMAHWKSSLCSLGALQPGLSTSCCVRIMELCPSAWHSAWASSRISHWGIPNLFSAGWETLLQPSPAPLGTEAAPASVVWQSSHHRAGLPQKPPGRFPLL